MADDIDMNPDSTGNLTRPAPPTKSRPSGTSSSSSSGNTSSTTSSAATSTVNVDYDGPGKDYNDTDPNARFLGIGGHPEIWKDSATGQMFIVHFAEGTEPPIPLLFEIPDDDTTQAFFGEGVTVVYDRTITTDEIKSTGAVKFGTTNNLPDAEGDPWTGFLDRVERLAEVSPWVNDDEILALIGGAYLENRKIADWELQTTDWWQTHNEQEREWLTISMSDPASAARRLSDNNLYVQNLFEKIGAEGNTEDLIAYVAQQYTMGTWSQAYTLAQVEAVTSGWGTLDEDFDAWLTQTGHTAATTNQAYEDVRALWNEWLGPAYQPTEDELKHWATRLRVGGEGGGDGREELVDMLRGQRLALFPEYTDPNRTWQDISRPWKNMAYQTWGVEADELDPRFQDIVRLNNATEAAKQMRQIGIDEGYQKVVDTMMSGVDSGMRRSVRGAV